MRALSLKAAVFELTNGDEEAAELLLSLPVDEMTHAVLARHTLWPRGRAASEPNPTDAGSNPPPASGGRAHPVCERVGAGKAGDTRLRGAPMWAGRHQASEMWQALAQAVSERRGRLGDTGGEARRRAALAWDVLAGRPAPRPWLPLAGAAALGIVVGWAAAHVYRSRRPQIEQALAAAGQQLQQTKAAVEERISKAKAAPGGPVEKAKAAFIDDGDEANDDHPSNP